MQIVFKEQISRRGLFRFVLHPLGRPQCFLAAKRQLMRQYDQVFVSYQAFMQVNGNWSAESMAVIQIFRVWIRKRASQACR